MITLRSTPLRTALPLAVGARAGACQVQAVLGSGPTGHVYRAFDAHAAEVVVLQEYLPRAIAWRIDGQVRPVASTQQAAFDGGMRRFSEHARALMRCRHPSLPRVHRHWLHAGTAYFCMEPQVGRTLQQRLRDHGALLDPADVRWQLRALADGLDALHRVGGVQGNVAPATIRLLDSGRPVLADVGNARIAGADKLSRDLVPGYAAIEQYGEDDLPVGPWTDVYGLAALALRMVSGKDPMAATLRRRGDDIASRLHAAQQRGHDAALTAGLYMALSMEPAERPQTIGEFMTSIGLADRRLRVRAGNECLLSQRAMFAAAAPVVAAAAPRPAAVMPMAASAAPARVSAPRPAPAETRAPAPAPRRQASSSLRMRGWNAAVAATVLALPAVAIWATTLRFAPPVPWDGTTPEVEAVTPAATPPPATTPAAVVVAAAPAAATGAEPVSTPAALPAARAPSRAADDARCAQWLLEQSLGHEAAGPTPTAGATSPAPALQRPPKGCR